MFVIDKENFDLVKLLDGTNRNLKDSILIDYAGDGLYGVFVVRKNGPSLDLSTIRVVTYNKLPHAALNWASNFVGASKVLDTTIYVSEVVRYILETPCVER